MGFDEIVILMDQDEAGQRAAKAIAEILPVGRAKIASLPCKDVNECLMKGQEKAIIEAVYQAKEYRPDGIVAANDYRDTITVDEAASAVSYPFSMLNEIPKVFARWRWSLSCGERRGQVDLRPRNRLPLVYQWPATGDAHA